MEAALADGVDGCGVVVAAEEGDGDGGCGEGIRATEVGDGEGGAEGGAGGVVGPVVGGGGAAGVGGFVGGGVGGAGGGCFDGAGVLEATAGGGAVEGGGAAGGGGAAEGGGEGAGDGAAGDGEGGGETFGTGVKLGLAARISSEVQNGKLLKTELVAQISPGSHGGAPAAAQSNGAGGKHQQSVWPCWQRKLVTASTQLRLPLQSDSFAHASKLRPARTDVARCGRARRATAGGSVGGSSSGSASRRCRACIVAISAWRRGRGGRGHDCAGAWAVQAEGRETRFVVRLGQRWTGQSRVQRLWARPPMQLWTWARAGIYPVC